MTVSTSAAPMASTPRCQQTAAPAQLQRTIRANLRSSSVIRKLTRWQPSKKRQRARGPLTTQAGLSIDALKDVGGLVVFSALPFVAVQALADSQAGKDLQNRLEERKPQLQQEEQQREKERAAVRQRLRWFGPERPQWLGPLSGPPPKHLKGALPGDYGFDPLGLGEEAAKLDRYFELELFHARWAMLGALGALIPETLQLAGITEFLEPRWWNVGYAKLTTGEELAYLGIPGLRIAGGQGVAIIAFCQVLLMFGPEYARACGVAALEPLGVYLPGDKNYPGGWPFDPLGLSKDAETYELMRVREIKNGRLAMVAWLGFAAQAVVTRKGPLENLLDVLPGTSAPNLGM